MRTVTVWVVLVAVVAAGVRAGYAELKEQQIVRSFPAMPAYRAMLVEQEREEVRQKTKYARATP